MIYLSCCHANIQFRRFSVCLVSIYILKLYGKRPKYEAKKKEQTASHTIIFCSNCSRVKKKRWNDSLINLYKKAWKRFIKIGETKKSVQKSV